MKGSGVNGAGRDGGGARGGEAAHEGGRGVKVWGGA